MTIHPGPALPAERLAVVEEIDTGEPLVDARDWLRFDTRLTDARGDYGHLRRGVLTRLQEAESLLDNALGLLVVEGYRRYDGGLADDPHQSGGAVDLTLCDRNGIELDLGTPVDAGPDVDAGRCFTGARSVPMPARARRAELARVMTQVGFVGDPAHWWHWSYGDRYWAYRSGRTHTLYAPVTRHPLPRQRRWPLR